MKKILILSAVVLFAASNVFAGASLSFDGLSRTRYEYHLNNADIGYSGSDEKSFFRFKFSGGITADFGSFASAYARLTTESRSYIYNGGGRAEYNVNEFIIDNLYFLMPRLFGLFEIKIGRFDLSGREYGGGFLIEDGTPLDGSRAFYFNGAKFAYHGLQNSVEFISVYNPEFDDLPVINDQDARLNSGKESGIIVYGRVKANDNVYFEPYYMWKQEEKASGGKLYIEETSLSTFGSYVKYDHKALTVKAQAALQIGDYGDETRSGYGGYVFADIKIKEILKPLKIGYMYLSGDDHSTGRQEAWNPLFSRGVLMGMSDIIASLYSYESGYGYWTNLQKFDIEAQAKPFDRSSVKIGYNFLSANETVINSPSNIFGSGKKRGDLFYCRLSYEFSKNINSFVHCEYFIPGNFYYDGAKDAIFVRAELTARI